MAIKYVCLSDLHLGEEDSLLTGINEEGKAKPENVSPVLSALVECLREVLKDQEEKPVLILGGDVMELALASMDVAGMAFETFLKETMTPGKELFDKSIFYIPGNHDHHLWEMARETQYVNWFTRHAGEGGPLKSPLHITPLIQEHERHKIPSDFINGLLARLAVIDERWKDVNVSIRYPNLGVVKDDRLAMFSHGHYLESGYKGVSILKDLLFSSGMPETIDILEGNNFAWLDFFWSALGRSGDAGESVEMVYEYLRSEEKTEELIENLAKNILTIYSDKVPSWLTTKGLTFLLKFAYKKIAGMERSVIDTAMSDKLNKGLHTYLDVYLKKEMNKTKRKYNRVVFTFGHTHKPFAKDMTEFDGYPTWVDTYNTGGWVVDEVHPQTVQGGMAVFLDEDLNAASIKLYQEKKNGGLHPVSVLEAGHQGEGDGPLKTQLSETVKPKADPWKTFTSVVQEEIGTRRDNLNERIKKIKKRKISHHPHPEDWH